MGHRELDVWKRAIAFVTSVYGATKDFPRAELYGLVSQIRRSAISIPCNIAEGSSRRSTKEYIQFLHVALGSASEIEVHLIISRNLDYLSEETFVDLSQEREALSRMLSGQIRSLKRRL